MLQPTKKRRCGLAVLAAGALVASVLAAGAGPAVAVTDRADHITRLSACVGDAATDHMFTDVSQGHAFRDAINCVAYYGITQGTGDGTTYSPSQEVTRAEMAVFIARAAKAAGVDLGGTGNARFNDIDGTWQEAQDAINRLASNGMIPSGGAFRPDDAITRSEMATFLVGLLVEAAPNVTKDSSGAILLGVPGSRSVADDRFPDTDDPEAAAIYELGVTRGASAAEVQDRTMPPLDLNYEPDTTVDRGQMAAFITRALAHTSVRPAGVSAQFDGADVIVSMRDDKYRPVSGAAVDVFWTTADRADSALMADGTCSVAEVTRADLSSFTCEIDGTDPVTGNDGDATVEVIGLRRVPAGGAAVWAWTGSDGDTVKAGTELYRLDVAEGADVGFASETLVTTAFNARRVRIGGSVLYTMQLRDIVSKVSTGVDGRSPARWSLSVRTQGVTDPEVQTLVSDGAGTVTF
ncbi:MAG: S-layer homology domain-containing protein, partial [Acidimicrobiaceae bacterium]|nr:S-layer homology domain-containing protein [Acidimicrobiaceae bacterium]